MDFGKIPPACNFIYQKDGTSLLTHRDSPYQAELSSLGGDVFRYCVTAERWPQKSQASLDVEAFCGSPSSSHGRLDESGALNFSFEGKELLRSVLSQAFGVLGDKWLLGFEHNETMRFYGLGEKNNGFEKTGVITKFWNTDAMADFGPIRVQHEPTDPLYVTIPYLLIRQPEGCIGILLNNPMPSFMNLAAREQIANLADARDQEDARITLGAYGGAPELFLILGADVRAVTRKLMRLSGRTPLPPLWSIGYQQSRWGYRDLDDLEELDRKFDELNIPCDGLWLDIDYMDAYKVFTVNEAIAIDGPQRIQALQDRGRRIVPILDPGVKYLEGYPIFDDGQEADVFCQTEEGTIYSGFVWPGRTAFPDFSMPEIRDWWARQVQVLTETYHFDGYWMDMNDPSTGSAELEDMRFNKGRDAHSTYHNQYASGMQQATESGLRRAAPGRRPFLISRSGYIGSARHSAIWTGDNWSNYFHLRTSLACSLNLALSGIPFNGPDVPGFDGEASADLAVDWHKAGFLFPFFRNHSAAASPRQEPWQYEQPYCDVIVHYIRLRYKLLPYLYQLFMRQAELGDPVLRPVFYEFPREFERFGSAADQFMVGPSILQAPKVDVDENERPVLLPSCGWFDATLGRWCENQPSVIFQHELKTTPLFFRESSLVPMYAGEQTQANKDLSSVDIHVFKRLSDSTISKLDYRFDDGETVDATTSFIAMRVYGDEGRLVVEVSEAQLDYQPLSIRLICYDAFEAVVLKQLNEEQHHKLAPTSVTLTGCPIDCFKTELICLSEETGP